MIARLVSNPHAFVARQSKYPGIQTQSIIAVVVGVVFGLQHIGVSSVLGAEFSRVSGPVMVLTAVSLAVPFLIWGLATVAIYFGARVYDGYFQIELLFRLVGWGLAPLIAAGAVSSGARLYALQGADTPPEPHFNAFQFEYEAYQLYVDAVAGHPVVLGGTVVAALFVLCSGYIWTLVVTHLSDLTTRQAMTVSALPVVVCLGWLVLPLV